jgi:quercetin dioxygenase-like cupin family protein
MHWMIWCSSLLTTFFAIAEPIVIPHRSLIEHGNNQNVLTGVATPSLGAQESEVWHSRIAVGSETPFHTHVAEEIVVLVEGELQATVGEKSLSCSAPCTIILQANKQHMLKNIGVRGWG